MRSFLCVNLSQQQLLCLGTRQIRQRETATGDSSDVTGGDNLYSSMCVMRFSLNALHIHTQSQREGVSFGVLRVEGLE